MRTLMYFNFSSYLLIIRRENQVGLRGGIDGGSKTFKNINEELASEMSNFKKKSIEGSPI